MPRQNVSVELFYGGAWKKVPAYTREPIEITRGKGDEQSEPTPSILNLTLDDRAQQFNPRNAASPLYGLVGRNTPIRVPVGSDVRFYGEVSSWKPGRSPEFVAGVRGDAWCDVEAAGVLRRVGQGTDALPSALRSFMSPIAGQLAYFPMEDGAQASAPGNAVPNASPATVLDVTFGQDDTLPSSAGVLTFNSADSRLDARIVGAPLSSYISAVMLFKLDALPGTAMELFRVNATGSAALMSLTMDSINFGRNVYDATGATLLSTGVAHQVDPTEWVALHFGLFQSSPGTIQWAFYRHQVNLTTIFGATGTFSGTLGRATRLTIGPDAGKAQAKFAHVILTGESFPFVTNGLRKAVDAWAGWETATQRLTRLCSDAGITFTSAGTTTELMGAQPRSGLVSLLSECETTDDGVLFEPRDSLGLHYRTRTDLYNQTAALTLNWAAGEVAPPLQPVVDDLSTRNDVTVKSVGGSSARAVLETGPLSVQDPPDGVGRYATTVDVSRNLDAGIEQLASWFMRKGTLDEIRYTRVTVIDSDDHPGLIDRAAAVDIGDRIVITNMPAGVSPDDASLIVVGSTEVIESHARRITFNCVPAESYRVGIWDDTPAVTSTRYDSSRSTLTNDFTTGTGTSASVTVTGKLWTTNGAHFPLDLNLAGARVRVTGISGTSSPQTFTVSKTVVNGVNKTVPAGTAVRLWAPGRWAL